MSRDDFRRYGCEFFGTLFLVFFAASAPTVSGLLNGALGPYAGGMSSGVALAAVIYAIGYTSGARGESGDGIVAATGNCEGGGSGINGLAKLCVKPGNPTPIPKYGKLKSCVLA